MNTLYCDLDGVLVDFARGYFEVFGLEVDSNFETVDWDAIASIPNFYANLPPMTDASYLWDYIRPYGPVILTGIIDTIPEAGANKRAWVRRYLGPKIQVITCLSREKSKHAKPGDVLIDDREKYRPLWVSKGGIWITHTSARESIHALKALGY